MDISTQNYNVGERTFVDDTDYSNFNLTSITTQLISTATTETTPQAIARLNKDIATLQSKIKSVPFPNGFMGRGVIKSYQNQIADKQKQIDYIKANGTYCERKNNCPKYKTLEEKKNDAIIEANKVGDRMGGGAVVVPPSPIGGGGIGGGGMGTPQYDSPKTEQPQDTATDDSATDTQTPAPMGMSMNTKYLIGAIVLIGGFYLLKKKN